MGRDESYIKNFVTGLQLLRQWNCNNSATVFSPYLYTVYALCLTCYWHGKFEHQMLTGFFFFLAVCPNRSKSLAHKCHIPQTIVWIILPGSIPHGLWPWLPVFTALRGLKVLAWWIYCWHLIVLKGKITNGWPWGWTIPDPRRSSLTPSCKCSDPSILTLPGLTFNSLIFDQSIKQTPAWDCGQRLWMGRPTIISRG